MPFIFLPPGFEVRYSRNTMTTDVSPHQNIPPAFLPLFPNGWPDLARREGFELPKEFRISEHLSRSHGGVCCARPNVRHSLELRAQLPRAWPGWEQVGTVLTAFKV